MKAHDRVAFDIQKTSPQPTAKLKSLEKLLDHNHTRIGGKPLILESDFRNTIDTAKNMCFTYSHLLWPPEKGALEWLTTSKTLSGGYLFVYPYSKDQILCNCKVKNEVKSKLFPFEDKDILIEVSELGEYNGAIGAATFLMEEIYNIPEPEYFFDLI